MRFGDKLLIFGSLEKNPASGNQDQNLQLHSFSLLGEMPREIPRTIIVKHHYSVLSGGEEKNAVLIIRNPFDAHIAEFHRSDRSSGGHVGHATSIRFASSGTFMKFQ